MSNLDAKFNPEVFRKNQPQIIAMNYQLATLMGVRLAYNASGYAAGRVLARNTVSGNYANYDDGASSGLNTAASILLDDVDVSEFSSTTGTVVAKAAFTGEVYEGKLLGLDSAGKADLGGRSIVDPRGTTIMVF